VTYSSNNITGAHHLFSLIISGQSNVESQSTLTANSFHLVSSGSSSFYGVFNIKYRGHTANGCSNVSFYGSASIAHKH
jgi:hypothetical protein